MENADYYLPEELWEKIFLRAQAESLLRSKSVCKSWNRIISNKSFIKDYGLHQKISENTRKYLLLNYCDRKISPFRNPFNYRDHCRSHRLRLRHYDSFYSAGLIDRKSNNVLGYYNDICCRDLNRCCLEVYGICDGLLCLSVHAKNLCDDYPIFLYNPFIRKWKEIIPPKAVGYSTKWRVSLCFGYYDDDYKVVRVHASLTMYEIYIYSLNADSWKSVKGGVNIEGADLEKFKIAPYPKTRLVNGIAYFVQGDKIVSFDLDYEKIRRIQLPGDIRSAAHVVMEEYGESIALIGSTVRFINTNNGVRVATGYGVAMWVLKQSDKSNSNIWEKKFNIEGGGDNVHRRILYPAVQAMGGFVNSNELVMRKWKIYSDQYLHREYFLFNVETGFQKQFPRPREQAGGVFLQRMNILTESLVLLNETTMPPFPSLELIGALLGCNSSS